MFDRESLKKRIDEFKKSEAKKWMKSQVSEFRKKHSFKKTFVDTSKFNTEKINLCFPQNTTFISPQDLVISSDYVMFVSPIPQSSAFVQGDLKLMCSVMPDGIYLDLTNIGENDKIKLSYQDSEFLKKANYHNVSYILNNGE